MLSRCRALVFDAYGITENTGPDAPLPMGLPTSLNRAALRTVWGGQPQYVVSPKADGQRMVVGFMDHVAFTMNRANKCAQFASWQPHAGAWRGTVLDVEWVTTEQRGRVLWIFDVLCIHGHNIRGRAYHHRLAAARLFLQEWSSHQKGPVWVDWPAPARGAVPDAHLPRGLRIDAFTVWCVKPVWYHTQVQEAYSWALTLGPLWLVADGLVYTPVSRSVATFRSLEVFKWKPVERQTVDFLVQRVPHAPQDMELLVLDDVHQLTPFARVPLRSDLRGELRPGSVYECRWENNTWIIHMARADKTEPNALFTAKRTCDDIAENLRLEDLMPPP